MSVKICCNMYLFLINKYCKFIKNNDKYTELMFVKNLQNYKDVNFGGYLYMCNYVGDFVELYE